MEDFTNLTYNEIRSKCKSYGLRANGKKVDLLTRLTNYFSQLGLGSDSQNNVKITEKTEAYEVFVTDDEDEVFLEKDFKKMNSEKKLNCEVSLDALKENKTTDVKVKENVTPTQKSNEIKEDSNKIRHPSNETVDYFSSDEGEYKKIEKKKVVPKKKGGRFDRQHKSIFEKAESIAERQERIKELHAKYEASVPDTFKRLATPKRLSSPGRPSMFPSEVRTGYDFSKAPMDTSKLGHALNRTPAPNFDVPKVLSEVKVPEKFQGRKKGMSLVEKLSKSYKKGNIASSNNINKDNKKSDISNKYSKGILVDGKKEIDVKSKKFAQIRSNTEMKREKKLNSCRK